MDIDIHDLENNEENEEDEVQLTPAEIIEIMEETWINEKFAPEILPNKNEIVECLLGQITYMEENIKNLESTDFKKTIHQLEVDRLRFLISSYLRMRLEKIENYAAHILEQENQRLEQGIVPYLTDQELKFAKGYSEALQQHFENITSYCPRLSREEWSQEAVKPNIHSFVFLKSKEPVGGIVLDDGDDGAKIVDLNCGSQVIISYGSVSNLVKKGEVHLI